MSSFEMCFHSSGESVFRRKKIPQFNVFCSIPFRKNELYFLKAFYYILLFQKFFHHEGLHWEKSYFGLFFWKYFFSCPSSSIPFHEKSHFLVKKFGTGKHHPLFWQNPNKITMWFWFKKVGIGLLGQNPSFNRKLVSRAPLTQSTHPET